MLAVADNTLLRHIVVNVAAYTSAAYRPRHLHAVLECVRTWLNIEGVTSVSLTIDTNDPASIEPLIRQLQPSPPRWRVMIAAWDSRAHRGRTYMLTHAHLFSWAAIAANATSKATAFIFLEDDLCPSAAALAAWASDTALLEASGAAAAGFQRAFYRYEITRSASDMHWQRVKDLKTATAGVTKYLATFINARAAAWRAAHNVSLGERFVLDERRPRAFRASHCSALPCTVANASMTPGRKGGWCSNYPTLTVATLANASGQSTTRAFIALANPYTAITAASRQLVTSFLLGSRGWNRTRPTSPRGAVSLSAKGTPSMKRATAAVPHTYRTRYKAYAVREYGSSTFHYAHEFIRFSHAGDWPQDVPPPNTSDPSKGMGAHGRGGMRRVLVPMVRHAATGSWALDTLAGIHHMSDRVVNGPRKGVEAYGARLRERDAVRCALGAPWVRRVS